MDKERVSVPCRGTTFLNRDEIYNNLDGKQVSVPCRGTTFLNNYTKYLVRNCKNQFPSPVGELHFLISYTENVMEE